MGLDFPDMSHLLQLQKDLWHWPQARAAVMIGAGFSLNSIPLPGVTSRFPTWYQLLRVMFDELYPSIHGKAGKTMDGSSALRIASEYEARFGEARLLNLIKVHVPDSQHLPGPLHTKLLKLPWRDVFTTNYDTLLERTKIVERSYQTVTDVSQLATSYAPRIIKLHGSLSDHSRLIVTEEDYRRYPKDYAGFVNTVQQSLLENVFVLLGFSGEDPNFLNWIGWIRDELGDKHAPIYLAGPLFLGEGERLLLERRGVTSIDLAPLFQGIPIPQGIHAASLSWFLDCLSEAKPNSFYKWPDYSVTAHDPPRIPPLIGKKPMPPAKPEIDFGKHPYEPPTDSLIFDVYKSWRWERENYPGWHVAPIGTRVTVWFSIDDWITPHGLDAINRLQPADRILFFYELNWRCELAMAPLFAEAVVAFSTIMDELYEPIVNGTLELRPKELLLKGSETQVITSWLAVSFGLLREARESYRTESWMALKDKIRSVVDLYQIETDRLSYEIALWELWNVEIASAKETLSNWQPSSWNLRATLQKAGLLAETNELDESRRLLRAALDEIRLAQQRQGRNIELLSLEGWCTFSICLVEGSQDFLKRGKVKDEFIERWQELSAFNCDPWAIIDELKSSLSQETPSQAGVEVQDNFDPDTKTVSHHFGASLSSYLPAFAFIRLYEEVGIPIQIKDYNIDGGYLSKACEWIVPFIDPFWSPALLVRACKFDDLKKGAFLSRTDVALMTQDLVQKVYEWCLRVLDCEIDRLSGLSKVDYEEHRFLEGLPEVLSRLSPRLNPTSLTAAFKKALSLYSKPPLRKHWHLVDSCCNDWFRRLFHSADTDVLFSWLPDLLTAPLFDDGLSGPSAEWRDPLERFPVDRIVTNENLTPEIKREILSIAKLLIRRANIETGLRREQLKFRLLKLFSLEMLDQECLKGLGTLMWEDTTDGAIPKMPPFSFFYNSVFLALPHPDKKDASGILKEHILRTADTKSFGKKIADFITDAARCTADSSSGKTEPAINWTYEESVRLFGLMIEWWSNNKWAFEHRKTHFGSVDRPFTAHYIGLFLKRIVLPHADQMNEEQWAQIQDLLDEMRKNGLHISAILPHLLSIGKAAYNQTLTKLLIDLQSEDEGVIAPGLEGLYEWFSLNSSGKLAEDYFPLSQAVIERVIFRREPSILTCIDWITRTIAEKPQCFSNVQYDELCSSLSPWHYSTKIEHKRPNTGYPIYFRTILRAFIARLAGVLHQHFRGTDSHRESFELWEMFCQGATLPEIRRGFSEGELLYRKSHGTKK